MKPLTLRIALTIALSAMGPLNIALAQTAAHATGDATSAVIFDTTKPAPPDALVRIKQVHDDIQAAEKSGQFDQFKKTFLDATTADFNFNSAQKATYTRDQYLATKDTVMKETGPAASVSWTIDKAHKSPVDTSVDVTTSRTLSSAITDAAGTYGTKGSTHQVQTTNSYYEHWIATKTSGTVVWKMDDMDTNSVKFLLDGKEWSPPAPKQTTQQQNQQRNYNTQRRTRRSNNYVF